MAYYFLVAVAMFAAGALFEWDRARRRYALLVDVDKVRADVTNIDALTLEVAELTVDRARYRRAWKHAEQVASSQVGLIVTGPPIVLPASLPYSPVPAYGRNRPKETHR